jgi:(p)ppGpp synthase/HD superfamily hydrolase
MDATDVQSCYQQAIKFAAAKHVAENQTIPGTNLPYVVHLSNVAMEILMAAQHTPLFDTGLAVQLALLHDVLEDTPTSKDELAIAFGPAIADGVVALTKNGDLPKDEKMQDSLARIKEQPKEVWAVKLADRITNLQAPPAHWSKEKIAAYEQEAITILEHLKGGNVYLDKRLQEKIIGYKKYI